MESNKHIPVLQNEAIAGLNLKDDSVAIDMTLGRAGDSSRILRAIPNGHLYAVDKDEEAIVYSQKVLYQIGSNFTLIHSAFSLAIPKLREEGLVGADAILFDIGVSSPQFDNPGRGFSYREDGPLDMRMDQEQKLTAYDVVNTYSESELRHIILEYGEDRSAPAIAHAIVKAREQRPIRTTLELVEVIKSALPSFILNKKGHPAKQTFQAIRYEVNQEEQELKKGLQEALGFLNIHGRVAVITFNSLEDRIVKNAFKEVSSYPPVNKYEPVPVDLKPLGYELVTRKPIEPSPEELESNPRSRSAKLRIIQKIGGSENA